MRIEEFFDESNTFEAITEEYRYIYDFPYIKNAKMKRNGNILTTKKINNILDFGPYKLKFNKSLFKGYTKLTNPKLYFNNKLVADNITKILKVLETI